METITTMHGVEMTRERFNQLLAQASYEGDANAGEQERKKLRDLKLRRLKIASEAYKEHKALYVDSLTEEPTTGYKAWQEFRDEFLVDRELNYRRVSDKEADVHFDRTADESLTELDTKGGLADVNQALDQVVADQTEAANEDTTTDSATSTAPIADASVVVPKRRGRPPGSKKATVVAVEANDAGTVTTPVAKKKSYYVPVSQRKAAAKKTPSSKAKAKAKSVKSSKPAKPAKVKAVKKGGSTSERAQHIIQMYQAKKWARKDTIEKLQSQIDGLGAAYASTLYQKFAK